MDFTITPNVKDHITKILDTDKWYSENLEMVPESIIGLGYQWYPIIIKSKVKDLIDKFVADAKFIVHPCINIFRSHDLTKAIVHDEAEITKEILISTIHMAHPAFYDGLSIYHTVVDPKVISNEIEDMNKVGHLIGFMGAMELCKLSIDGENFHLNQERCNRECYEFTDNWEFNIKLEATNNRIFNWQLVINLLNKKQII